MSTPFRLKLANPVLFPRRSRHISGRRSATRHRPTLEHLEDRPLLDATLNVSTLFGNASEVGPTPAIFRITRTGDLSSSLEAPVSFDGKAKLGEDYQVMDKTAVFDAGSNTAYITALPRNDAIQEGNETITLTLQPGPGYTVGSPASATATIADQYVSGSPGVFDSPNPRLSNGLSYFQAGISGGQLHLVIGLEKPTDLAPNHVAIYINADQDVAIGDTRYGSVAGQDYLVYADPGAIGGSYQLNRLPSVPGISQLQLIATGTPHVQGNLVTLDIPTSLIGSPSAVDVYAYYLDDNIGIASGNGDRCPDYGAIDTSTGRIVVRNPGKTYITDMTDPAGDSKGPFDLKGAQFATVADQFYMNLDFAQVVDPADPRFSGFLTGQVLLDTDQSLVTGQMAYGTEIPTWGGDMTLNFDVKSFQGLVLTQHFDPFNINASTVLGLWNNDGRWAASGNVLSMSGSLSMFDAFLLGSRAADDVCIDQRVPTDGRMNAKVQLGGYFPPTFIADDNFPDGFGMAETATGRVLQPLAWDPGRTISADDPPNDVSDPGFHHSVELLHVDAEVVADTLVVQGIVDKLMPTETDLLYRVFLDTDMNSATGHVLANKGGLAIGADYIVEATRMLEGGFINDYLDLLHHPDRPDEIVTVHSAAVLITPSPTTNSHGSFTIAIPLELLQGLGSRLRLYVTAGFRDDPVIQMADIAPPSPLVVNTGIGPPALRISDVTVTEGNAGTKAATFTVSLSAAAPFPVTVKYGGG